MVLNLFKMSVKKLVKEEIKDRAYFYLQCIMPVEKSESKVKDFQKFPRLRSLLYLKATKNFLKMLKIVRVVLYTMVSANI